MVVNILKSTDNMESTFLYNKGKVDIDVASIIHIGNIPGSSLEDIRETFARYERMNRRSKAVSFHMSIDPMPGVDNMTDDDIRKMAIRLMDGLGYSEQPFVVFKHEDIDRTHYHVLSIRVDGNGKKIDDFQEKRRCFLLAKGMEKDFGYVMGNRLKQQSKEGPLRFDRTLGDVSGQVRNIYGECLKYHFTSYAQFQLILRTHGLLLDESSGHRTRFSIRGLDSRGKPCTKNVSDKAVGLDLYRLYSDRALRSIDEMKVMAMERTRIKSCAAGPLRDATSPAHFRNMMAKCGIDFRIERDPKTHRIVDANIIDHVTKCAFRLSEMGPDFSVEMFQEVDEQKWGHQENDYDTGITLGDILFGLGAGGSKSQEKDMKDRKKKKKQLTI